jgi:hypothetical protein
MANKRLFQDMRFVVYDHVANELSCKTAPPEAQSTFLLTDCRVNGRWCNQSNTPGRVQGAREEFSEVCQHVLEGNSFMPATSAV